MPDIGDIKKAKELGWKGGTTYVWAACIGCGKKRWVQLSQSLASQPTGRSTRCHQCAGKVHSLAMLGKFKKQNNPQWKGGRLKAKNGYVRIWLDPDDFFFSMGAKTGRAITRYVFEHRLVMAKQLGRCLHS